MGNGPWRPAREIERAVERGELDMAEAIAKDLARNSGRPIPLALAAKLLPLVAAQRGAEYDRWAARWLGRWLTETPRTVDRARGRACR
jgi:hypothetical protein